MRFLVQPWTRTSTCPFTILVACSALLAPFRNRSLVNPFNHLVIYIAWLSWSHSSDFVARAHLLFTQWPTWLITPMVHCLLCSCTIDCARATISSYTRSCFSIPNSLIQSLVYCSLACLSLRSHSFALSLAHLGNNIHDNE